MKIVPISDYLDEFDVGGSTVDVQPILKDRANPATHFDSVKEPSTAITELGIDNHAQELAQKFQEGVSHGEDQAKEVFDQQLKEQLSDLSERHEVELADLRDQLANQTNDWLSARFIQLEKTLADALVRIINPFISSSIHSKIIEDLKVAIFDILQDRDSCELTIKGPPELLKLLKDKLSDLPAPIKFLENDDLELSVDTADTRIESRFQLWADMLGKQAR